MLCSCVNSTHIKLYCQINYTLSGIGLIIFSILLLLFPSNSFHYSIATVSLQPKSAAEFVCACVQRLSHAEKPKCGHPPAE